MKIIFNGQEYQNLESMPMDVRQNYLKIMGIMGDSNQNGIPDLIEHGGCHVTSRIVINGKEYQSAAEMPENIRALYETVKNFPANQSQTTIELHSTNSSKIDPQILSTALQWTQQGRTPSLLPVLVVLIFLLIILVLLWFSGIKPESLLGK